MPDRLIDLFIKLCLQNSGKIGIKKRDKYFSMLSDSEIVELEAVVQRNMMKNQEVSD